MTTSKTPGAAQNRAAGGCYGEKITTGSSGLTVLSLGRWFVAGNSGSHWAAAP